MPDDPVSIPSIPAIDTRSPTPPSTNTNKNTPHYCKPPLAPVDIYQQTMEEIQAECDYKPPWTPPSSSKNQRISMPCDTRKYVGRIIDQKFDELFEWFEEVLDGLIRDYSKVCVHPKTGHQTTEAENVILWYHDAHCDLTGRRCHCQCKPSDFFRQSCAFIYRHHHDLAVLHHEDLWKLPSNAMWMIIEHLTIRNAVLEVAYSMDENIRPVAAFILLLNSINPVLDAIAEEKGPEFVTDDVKRLAMGELLGKASKIERRHIVPWTSALQQAMKQPGLQMRTEGMNHQRYLKKWFEKLRKEPFDRYRLACSEPVPCPTKIITLGGQRIRKPRGPQTTKEIRLSRWVDSQKRKVQKSWGEETRQRKLQRKGRDIRGG